MTTLLDAWGAAVAASDPASVTAWNAAWTDALHFVGDPFATLATANETDPEFGLGSVFCAAYRMLGGAPWSSPLVQADLARAAERARLPRELGHVEALHLFAAGNFTAAARRWDQVNRQHVDFAAVRFAHDAYLHIGNTAGRLRSSAAALTIFDGQPGWNLIASQYAFALEEAGHFDEAELVAYEALEADPMDLWATHALAHVYEHADKTSASLELLRSRQSTWEHQDGLAVHIWWHLTLRLIAAGEYGEVLAIHDRLVPEAATAFRLCDLTSMLWRLELAGVAVGDRWDHLADAFAGRPERHTSGFLDLHAALVYTRRPDHPEAQVFFAGIDRAYEEGTSENHDTFRSVVRPMVHAIRTGGHNPCQAVELLDSIEFTLQRIGGSNAQRDIVARTRAHHHAHLSESTDVSDPPVEPTIALEAT